MDGLPDLLAGRVLGHAAEIRHLSEAGPLDAEALEKGPVGDVDDAVDLDGQFMQRVADLRGDHRLSACQVEAHLRERALPVERRVEHLERSIVPAVAARVEDCRIMALATDAPDGADEWFDFHGIESIDQIVIPRCSWRHQR